jgi:hypothetical protein
MTEALFERLMKEVTLKPKTSLFMGEVANLVALQGLSSAWCQKLT